MALRIAAKSSKVKGTYQRALKEMPAIIHEATEELATRIIIDENLRLQALSERQEAEILQLRKELGKVRAEMSQLKCSCRQVSSAIIPSRHY